MKLALLIISILFLAPSASAQDPWPQEKPEQRQQTVINEDGGRSYLVLPTTTPLVSIVKPGQGRIGDVQQCTIFLGSAWSDPTLRTREQRLSSLVGRIRDGAQFDDPSNAPVFSPTPPLTIEKLDIAGSRTISDLELQRILTDVLKDSSPTGGDSVYMVFLDSTLRSSLGSLLSDKHFIAYHGFLNLSGRKIHYAVVPFQSDAQAAYQTALRTFIVAALHSDDAQH